MTCDEFEQMLLDSGQLSGGGDGWMLRASRAALIQAHVENCPACTTKMAGATKLQDALDQLRASTMRFEAPAAVEKNLLDAFRRQAAKRDSLVPRAFAWRLVVLSAAVLVLAVAGMQLLSNLRPDRSPQSGATSHGNKVELRSATSPGLSGTAVKAFNESRGNATQETPTMFKRHVKKAIKTGHERTAQPSRIRINNELALNGGGSIVRVTLPVSSLVAMGVPVGPDLSESRVTADVWMDPFGAVVGIRLVPAKASAD
jgi:hypothetical protein